MDLAFLGGAGDWLYAASTWVVPIALAVTLHEAAHGFAAWRLGDDTAKRLGRLTLNPIRHVDPVGTIGLPALLLIASAPFLIGWARPIPVTVARLGHPRRDMVLVALAGPAANVLLAVLAVLLFHTVPLVDGPAQDWLRETLVKLLVLNCLLAVFNMLPVPPLDGGRVLTGILPLPLARRVARLETWGILLILGVLIGLPLLGDALGQPMPAFGRLILDPALWLARTLDGVFGVG